ncbi:hypothetical protein COS81_00935 [candidate division WWE3 bacterium CG06_land_8_20_14_3_00_42_16]|uniref:Uncharacterized protein n=1 Tax=candidate division WWE3 bacterium CG06_land_8_20_14_3_00_42_16 TaxID=1975083 RepID=A0A2M7APB8_UNCKA|nr:MAG: hypothetical protein AUJ38_00215 [bacterium CG1_02_42_9]PIU69217.1 MAG: hypothetical protein COS81_00935 [candidate division WWE3 bacterium CG06_land_8_20_14_3_00_42_16]
MTFDFSILNFSVSQKKKPGRIESCLSTVSPHPLVGYRTLISINKFLKELRPQLKKIEEKGGLIGEL